jgi:hypothetical protein
MAKVSRPPVVRTYFVDGVKFTVLAPQQAPGVRVTARPVGTQRGGVYVRGRRSA